MIAIKDIKMPVNCEECFARLLSWCRLDEEERMVIPALPDESFEGRPDWCPLVDVPDEAGNCSEIPNNSDCVSRRAAVEAIANQSRFSAEEIINICDKSVQDGNGWLDGLKEAILAVLELPSAQPEFAKDTNVTTNDLIDRQAAIDALNKLDVSDGVGISAVACDLQEEAIRSIENLPSAQPERKKGEWTIDEDCEGKSRTVTCNLCGYEEFNWHNPNFCPNCGADMRGEQDEG